MIEAHPFRVTRDAEVVIQELEAEDLLETIERGVRQRRFGSVVRMTIDHEHAGLTSGICWSKTWSLNANDVYTLDPPLGMSDLMELYDIDRHDLKDPPFLPALPAGVSAKPDDDIFAAIRRQDILLHHPYDSFTPVVDFLASRRARSERAGHQADALPRRAQLAGRGGAAGSRARTASRSPCWSN